MRLLLGTLLGVTLLAASTAGASEPQVRVPSRPSPASSVTVSFAPRRALPRGGYYYAVAVLETYPGFSTATPPPCAVSSDMQRTRYAYPHGRRTAHLTLVPAPATQRGWCAGGTYVGAVYEVPHAPRCGSQSCEGNSAEYGSPCWEIEPGHVACGEVALPPRPEPEAEPSPQPPQTYSYPGGLPAPREHSARVLARFKITFSS